MSATTTEAAIDPAQHLGLVRAVAHRLRVWAAAHGIEFDDLLGEGALALVHAVRGFDPSRGIQFSTMATRSIRNAIFNLVKTACTVKRLHPSRRVGDDTHLRLIGVEDVQHDHHFGLAAAVKRLPSRTRKVISWRYGLDGRGKRTHREIGERLGLTRERARQIEKEGLDTLRTALQR